MKCLFIKWNDMIFFICWYGGLQQLTYYLGSWKLLESTVPGANFYLIELSCINFKGRCKRGWLTSKVKFHLLKGNIKNLTECINDDEMSRFLHDVIHPVFRNKKLGGIWVLTRVNKILEFDAKNFLFSIAFPSKVFQEYEW